MLLRQAVGEVLRGERSAQGATLRQVACRGRVALGYLSEIERGRKEPSSEVLAAVAAALGVPVPDVLRRAATLLESDWPRPVPADVPTHRAADAGVNAVPVPVRAA